MGLTTRDCEPKPQNHRTMPPRLLRWRSKRFRLLFMVLLCLGLEDLYHQYSYHVPRPSRPLDPPFQVGCQTPATDAPRENATIVMLTRNEDLKGAASSIQSLEDHFNRWFHYPVVFLNNKPWSEEFKTALSDIVTGEAIFEVLPEEAWGYPEWMDGEEGRKSVLDQGENGIFKGGMESYHHMCRFYSGKFYDVEILKKYKWYWRVEPNVEFSCAMTYDPFVEMAKHKKVYGYTVALWEVDNTVPSLFRAASDFMREKRIKTTNLWRSMIKPSWVPRPFRALWASEPLRDAEGDEWNLCHYWSNFEIADLDFYRSRDYREFFEFLDRRGGFYSERWGDASVHALAAAMLLEPEQLHHFQDIGYYHDPWRVCPANARGKQLTDSNVLRTPRWSEERDDGVGCRCECEAGRNFQSVCFNNLQKATHPKPWRNVRENREDGVWFQW